MGNVAEPILRRGTSYQDDRHLYRLRRPGDGELIIDAKTYEVPGNHVLQCLELGRILSRTTELDAGRRGFQLAHPKSNSSRPPPSVSSVVTLFPKWLTSCLM